MIKKKYLNAKKNNNYNKYLILSVFIIIILSLFIIYITTNDKRDLTILEKIIKDSFVKIEYIIFSPFKSKLCNENTINDRLKIENEELKKTVKTLQELNDLNNTLVLYDSINATVINRNPSYWYNTVTIDKGMKNGIKKDMAVISIEGIVGKIIKVSNYTSEVKLITTLEINNKMSVGIIDDDILLNGLISGYESKKNLLEVEGVSEYKDIKINSKVITTGFGGIIPRGILVGYVRDIKLDKYEFIKTIKVEPSVDFNNLRYVIVLKRK